MPESSPEVDWHKAIRSMLSPSSSSSLEVQQVKKLRKMVLLSLQLPDDDKTSKKQFKKAVQAMEAQGTVRLDADGSIALVNSGDDKKKKKKKDKSKKRQLEQNEEEEESKDKNKKKSKKSMSKDADDEDDEDPKESQNDTEETSPSEEQEHEEEVNNNESTVDNGKKNRPCKGNPQGCTRLFLGNLPFVVDESSLAAFLPGQVTHIKWITDKETGKFYGSAFCEMDNSVSAAEAVAMAGEKLIGRPIKINFAPAREGDLWPPKAKVVSGGSADNNTKGGQAGGSGVKAMSAKPENCVKLFCGNLSYEIDDETITKFFASVDAELKAVRWIHHKDCKDETLRWFCCLVLLWSSLIFLVFPTLHSLSGRFQGCWICRVLEYPGL